MFKKTSPGELTLLNEMDHAFSQEILVSKLKQELNLVNSLPTGPGVWCWVQAGGGQMTVIKVS